MKKENIVKILRKELGHIYCHNCAHNFFESTGCDDCNRKQMGWGLGLVAAIKIASQILKLDNGKKNTHKEMEQEK